jgi:hypothetical protein
VFPELEAVKEKRGREAGDQDDERGISAVVQRDSEPCAADEDSKKPDCRKDVRAAQAKPANEARADQRKKIGGDGVCVIVVNLEERFDLGQTFTADDRQPNVERRIWSGNRVLRRDQLDPRVTDKKSVGSEIRLEENDDDREEQ